MKNCSIFCYISLLVISYALVGCKHQITPKPYGYFRLELPTQEYEPSTNRNANLPYMFSINQHANIQVADSNNPYHINIEYPSINATIHCSYFPIQNNLPKMLDDAQEMVYSHSIKASAIPEQEYVDPTHHIYGVFYELQGNTATPAQFFLTDSVHRFFRAAVYINTIPNQDSLAPVIDYLIQDSRLMIESFRWVQK